MPIFDSWPGEKLAIKIADLIERAGVGLLRPMQLRREGLAKAEIEHLQRLAIAQAEKDVADLAAGKVTYDPASGRLLPAPAAATARLLASPGAFAEPTGEAPTGTTSVRLGSAYGIGSALSRTIVLREAQRALNLERVVQKAQAETVAAEDAAVADAPVHPDWFSRWRDGAQDVSDDDVQRLWARALAGEAQAPGRYSLRTLDFLRSVSKSEAEFIGRLGPFAVGGFVYRDEELLERKGLPYSALDQLQHLGLLAGVEALGVVWVVDPKPDGPSVQAWICGELGISCSVTKQIEIPCYTVTALGREMLTLGQFKADREYVNSLAKFTASNGATCKVGIAAKRPGGHMRLLEPIEQFDPPSPTNHGQKPA